MAQQRTEYSDTCEIHNTDRGKTFTAEILNFVPEKILDVSLDRSVKISMRWQNSPTGSGGFYIGSMAGMEFTSEGPDSVTYKLGR